MSTGRSPTQWAAGADVNRCRFLKGGASEGKLIHATANAEVLGVSGQSLEDLPGLAGADANIHARSGKPVDAETMIGSEVLVLVGSGGVTKDARVISDGTGQAVLAATTGTTRQLVCGIALQDAAAGEFARIWFVKMIDRPALS